MKKKHLLLVLGTLAIASGLWLAKSPRRTPAPPESRTGVSLDAPHGMATGSRTLRPPDPTRRFIDFTPEQRVEFARRGQGPGG